MALSWPSVIESRFTCCPEAIPSCDEPAFEYDGSWGNTMIVACVSNCDARDSRAR